MDNVVPQGLLLCYLYARVDRAFCETLDTHLTMLKSRGWIRTWSERAIEVGQSREGTIRHQLAQADLVVVLVSSDFLASDICSGDAMAEAIARHEAGKAVVVPIIVRPVEWSLTPFERMQAFPTNGNAVNSWPNRDRAYVDIVQGLTRLIERRWGKGKTRKTQPLSPQSFWTVPYRQNRFFVGRETLLEHISSAFSSWGTHTTPVIALSGLGGIGKTQTALEYAYRSVERYQAIFWINASSQETVVADLLMLAEALGFSPTKASEAHECLVLIKRWLEEHQGWLLILDALADFSLVSDTLPLRAAGHVLITTHLQVSQAIAEALEVHPLVEPEALTLLMRRSGFLPQKSSPQQLLSEDVVAARRLCQMLDGLPLALDQAGAYIEKTDAVLPSMSNAITHNN